MKINILSNAKGKILAAELPTPQVKQGMVASCGPVLHGNLNYSGIAVTEATREHDLSDLLARSSIKRSKGEHVLETRPATAAQRKKPRGKPVKKPTARKAKKR